MIKAYIFPVIILCLGTPLYLQAHDDGTQKLQKAQTPLKHQTSLLSAKNMYLGAAFGCIATSFAHSMKNATTGKTNLTPTAFAILAILLSIHAEKQQQLANSD